MSYSLDFSSFAPYAQAFAYGAWITLKISILSFLLGTMGGIVLALLFIAAPGKAVLLIINDMFRALPPLVLIFFIYFFPYKDVFDVIPPGPVACTIFGLAFAQAAYTADITYHAHLNVSPALVDAGRALGLGGWDIWARLVWPDILRQTLPAQVAFFIGIVRLSSLGAVIGAQDVVNIARIAIAQNFRSIEAWIIVGAIYIIMITPLTFMARSLERSSWLRRRF